MVIHIRKAVIFAAMVLLCHGAFAQYASFYNRLSSVLVIQDAKEDASPSFGSLSNRVVGRYDSEKFTLWGRAEFTVTSADIDGTISHQWKDLVRVDESIMEFAGAIRPFPFLELMFGKGYGGSKGEFALAGYTLTGAFGYATEASYGLRKWSDGEGFTILFRGDGLGIEGLRIGWNALPFLRDSQERDRLNGNIPYGALRWDNKARWYTTVSVNYTLAQLITFNLAARLDTAKDANQTVGFYTEFIGLPGLRANAGVTLDTKDPLADRFYALTQVRSMVWYSKGNLFPADVGRFENPNSWLPEEERKLSTAVNAGIEYSFNGLGLPLMIAADMGITAGRREATIRQGGDKWSVLPLLVGGLVQYNITEPLLFRLQVRYADDFASVEAERDSAISIMPRLHYNAGKIGEFRIEPAVLLTKSGTADWVTGFLVGAFWQYNF